MVSIDIWSIEGIVVVPTNGVLKADGHAVMGAGLAKQAAERYPGLPRHLGDRLKARGNHVHFFDQVDLVTFPTKEHFKDPSPLKLVLRSAVELYAILPFIQKDRGPILVPRVGCGLGGLDWDVVKPHLERLLEPQLHRFQFVEP